MANKRDTQAQDDLPRYVERAFSHGTRMAAGDEGEGNKIEIIPTGLPSLDQALGIGGLPKGRIIEIYGMEGSGKTMLALTIIAQAQKQGAVAAFIDTEHTLDLHYARDLGVDCSKMLLSQPDYLGQALDVLEAVIRSGQIGVVVVDSVAALTPNAEINGGMAHYPVGLQARLMSRAMRKLATLTHQTGTTVIFTNQIHMKSDGMVGSPETTPSGNALKFYASVRLDVRRIESIKKDEHMVGNRVRIKVVKNKLAPPYNQCEIALLFDSGLTADPREWEHQR